MNNLWFKAPSLEHETLDEPLRGEHRADIAIIGGSYTGLLSALNINPRIPGVRPT